MRRPIPWSLTPCWLAGQAFEPLDLCEGSDGELELAQAMGELTAQACFKGQEWMWPSL